MPRSEPAVWTLNERELREKKRAVKKKRKPKPRRTIWDRLGEDP